MSAHEQELSAIYENVPGILFYIAVEPNGEFRFVSVSREFLVATGLTREQIVGSLVGDVIPEPSRDMVLNHYREAIRTGQTVRWEEESVYPSGRRYGEVAVTPLPSAGGAVTHLIGIVHDITERIQAKEAMRDREHQLHLALAAARAASWMRDAGTGCVHWDDRFRKLYGFAPDEPASFETWLNRVHEEDRGRVLEILYQMQNGKKDTFDSTFRIVRPDGTVAWIESFGRAHRDADGRLIHFIGIELDVTERRQAEQALLARRDDERDRALQKETEEELRRSHAELEQRTVQLRRLASQLTLTEQNAREQLARTLHDGLQQILFTAEITLNQAVKATSRDNQVRLLQRARVSVKEAMDAARSLSVNLFPPVLHLGGLPAALAWLSTRAQEQYGITVNVTADPLANPAGSDARIMLFETVRELVFNAVKHAHVDRVDVSLSLVTGDTIHIEVSDEGVGFDPTATLHYENQHQIGLGLFSIQERLALLGGRLDIESAPGKGSRFTLTLPGHDVPRPTTDDAEISRHDTGWQESVRLVSDSATSKYLRVLIADDHAVARAGLRELFSRCPPLYVVGEAANGIDAISQAIALKPDVIVMDVSMPQMNGIDATREIHATLPRIRIAGLSTYEDQSTERLMRQAGAEAYFTKKEGTDRLLHYLRSLRPQALALSNNSGKP
jgi:PAS domain S-box-containing protein